MFLQMTSLSPLEVPGEGVFKVIAAIWSLNWWRLPQLLSRLLVRNGFQVNRFWLLLLLLLCWLLVPLSVVLSLSLLDIKFKWKKSAARLKRPVSVRSLPRLPLLPDNILKKGGGIKFQDKKVNHKT